MLKSKIVSVHLVSGRTVQGRFVRFSRRFMILCAHKIEADGVLVESVHEQVLIPRKMVELIEVVE